MYTFDLSSRLPLPIHPSVSILISPSSSHPSSFTSSQGSLIYSSFWYWCSRISISLKFADLLSKTVCGCCYLFAYVLFSVLPWWGRKIILLFLAFLKQLTDFLHFLLTNNQLWLRTSVSFLRFMKNNHLEKIFKDTFAGLGKLKLL